jgi:hypothetical protein
MNEECTLFLKTGLSQVTVTNILIEKLKSLMEYLTYNVKRYNVPVTLVLFYTEEDISQQLKESIRLTDVLETIQVGSSYFHFIFLPFTDEIDSYTFVKHVEYVRLSNIEHTYYYEKLQPVIYNNFNFINNYLFEIAQKKESSI